MREEVIREDSTALSYTVIGSRKETVSASRSGARVSAAILAHCGRTFDPAVAISLFRAGIESVLYLTSSMEPGLAQKRTHEFLGLRFMLFSHDTSPAIMMNGAMREASGDLVLVLDGEMSIHESGFSGRLLQRIEETGYFGIAPRLFESGGGELAVASIPLGSARGREFRQLSIMPDLALTPTLYPVGFAGFYNRSEYRAVGGCDIGYSTRYWAEIDLGFRVWLSGRRFGILSSFSLTCKREILAEDRGCGRDAARFWLKNIAPVYDGDRVVLPRRSLWTFLQKRKGQPLRAVREYRELRIWVRENAFRFVTDSAGLTEMWGDTV